MGERGDRGSDNSEGKVEGVVRRGGGEGAGGDGDGGAMDLVSESQARDSLLGPCRASYAHAVLTCPHNLRWKVSDFLCTLVSKFVFR